MTPNPFRETRDRLGWTQKRLAEALGLHRVSVAQKETGARPIASVELLALECLLWRAGLIPPRDA